MALWRRKTEGEALRDLLDRMTGIESRQKTLELQWEETYEKVLVALRRLAKRARDLAERETASQDAPGLTNSEGALPDGGGLTGLHGEPLDPISRAIHARRARVVSSRGDGGER